MKNYILAPVFLFFACFALQAQEAGRPVVSPPQVQMDNDFVRNATQSGLSEIKLGQLAQQQSGSSAIRDYGKMMVADHQKANDELINLSRDRGYRDIPTQPAINARNEYDKLSRLTGPEFDKAFVKQVVKEHEQTVKLFKEQAENGKDEQVRNWARKTLPTLERHLEHSLNLDKSQNK